MTQTCFLVGTFFSQKPYKNKKTSSPFSTKVQNLIIIYVVTIKMLYNLEISRQILQIIEKRPSIFYKSSKNSLTISEFKFCKVLFFCSKWNKIIFLQVNFTNRKQYSSFLIGSTLIGVGCKSTIRFKSSLTQHHTDVAMNVKMYVVWV